MRKYFVYLDDSRNVYKIAVPAENEKAARKYVEGNGEIIAVKDVTDEMPINHIKVYDALKNAGFGENEADFIVRALQQINITDC
jgi:hypothetical protein